MKIVRNRANDSFSGKREVLTAADGVISITPKVFINQQQAKTKKADWEAVEELRSEV